MKHNSPSFSLTLFFGDVAQILFLFLVLNVRKVSTLTHIYATIFGFFARLPQRQAQPDEGGRQLNTDLLHSLDHFSKETEKVDKSAKHYLRPKLASICPFTMNPKGSSSDGSGSKDAPNDSGGGDHTKTKSNESDLDGGGGGNNSADDDDLIMMDLIGMDEDDEMSNSDGDMREEDKEDEEERERARDLDREEQGNKEEKEDEETDGTENRYLFL
jgi:hypothetical protein